MRFSGIIKAFPCIGFQATGDRKLLSHLKYLKKSFDYSEISYIIVDILESVFKIASDP